LYLNIQLYKDEDLLKLLIVEQMIQLLNNLLQNKPNHELDEFYMKNQLIYLNNKLDLMNHSRENYNIEFYIRYC
jgi:hypothetical protein